MKLLRNNIKGSVFFLSAIALFYSCTKEIDINLNDADPQIVIEGNITDTSGPYLVTISKTVNFSSSNVYPPVSGATVQITDNTAGVTDLLLETSPGKYETSLIEGVSGHSYQLTVSSEGKTYTAISIMPAKVLLDSVTYQENSAFGNTTINAVPNYQDPPGVKNFYKFEQQINGKKLNRIFTSDDRLSDGKYIKRQLFSDSSYLNRGDTLLLYMNSIDNNVLAYFEGLEQVTDGNSFQSASPANPSTNISNNALGYFSAHTVLSNKSVVKY